MAGVIALDRGPQAALALRRLDAARQIARRELRRLTDLARSHLIGADEMRHIVAFNGLTGGLPITDLRKTVGDELTASRRSADDLQAPLLTLIQQELRPHTTSSRSTPSRHDLARSDWRSRVHRSLYRRAVARSRGRGGRLARLRTRSCHCFCSDTDPDRAGFRIRNRSPRGDRRGKSNRPKSCGLATGSDTADRRS